jgi:hypothetical protein
MKLDCAKVFADDGLSRCSLQARGAWWWLLMRMHSEGASGVWEGTMEDLAHSVNCVGHSITKIVAELKRKKVADFEELEGGVIRVINRKMAREAISRRADSERKSRRSDSESVSDSESIPDSFPIQSKPHVRADVFARPGSDYDSSLKETQEPVKAGRSPRAHKEAAANLPDSVPWQIRMYVESCGRAPAAGFWPAITSQVTRRDVWQTVLDRADLEGWKTGNVNARVKEYLDTERTMYPPEKRNGQKQGEPSHLQKLLDTGNPDVLKAAGFIIV